MSKMYSWFFAGIIAVSVLFYSPALKAGAAGLTCPFPGCFDGVAVSQVLCTCSGNYLTWFAPLYIYGSPAPMTGALVFQPGTMLYQNYWISPGRGVVGTYSPGVQACYMHSGDDCVPVPNLGLILPFTGSSMPGGGYTGMGASVGAGVATIIGATSLGITDSGGSSSGGTSGSSGTGSTPVTYTGRMIITKGGTYSGNWESNDPDKPAVEVKTNEHVTIINSHIRGKGTLIAAGTPFGSIDLTILNTYGYGENPDVNMEVPGRFLSVSGVSKLVIANNYIEGTRGISIVGASGSKNIRIANNIVKNIDGRLSGGPGVWRGEDIDKYYNSSSIDVGSMYGQFVQLNNVTNAHVEIAWNQIINEPYKSRVEDVISVFESSGKSSDPINIHDNLIKGAYPLDPKRDIFSGGGIMTGDGDQGTTKYVVAKNNTVLETSNYGISASSGSSISISTNRILNSSKLPDGSWIKYDPGGGNVGIAIFKGYGLSLSNVGASNNTVGWTRPDGQRNDWYVPEASYFNNNKHYTGGAVPQSAIDAEFSAWQSKLTSTGNLIGPL